MHRGQTGSIVRAGIRAFRRSFLHMVGVLAVTSVLLAVALWAILAVVVPIVWAQLPTILDAGSELTLRGTALVALEVGLPVTLLSLLSTAVAWGALAKLADDALAQRSLSIRAALARGFRRAPALAGATALVLAGSAILILLAPLFMVAGIVGLLGAPIASALRSRGKHVRWPAPRKSILRSLPLVEPVRLIARWGLFIPAASLEQSAGRSVLVRSRQLVADSGPAGTIVIVLTGISFMVVAVAFDTVQRTGAPFAAILGLFIVTQVLLTGAPVAILTALFRSESPTSPATLAVADRQLRPRPVMHATAFGLIIALVAAPALLPTPASAAAVSASGSHSFEAPPAGATTSTTSIVTSPFSSSPGETVTLTAYVYAEEGTFDVPTGSVIFAGASGTIETVSLVDGIATTTVSGLADGSHTFTADYSGDGIFVASNDSVIHQVVTTSSTLSLESSPSPSDLGEAVTLTATVTGVGAVGEPTGSVTFSDQSGTIETVTLAGGTASTILASPTGGSHTFTAYYSGDGTYPTSNDSIAHQVSLPGTEVVVTVSPSPSILGDSTTLTAVVSASGVTLVPTGSVTFVDGTAELGTASLVNGTATLSTAALAAGVRTIGATYDGDSNFPSASGSVAHTVRAPVTATIDGPVSSRAGEDVTFTIAAAAEPGLTPTGEVTVTDGGTEIFRATVDATGAAVFTVALGVGPHSLIANYEGDAINLPGSSTPFDHSVQMALTSTDLASSALPSAEGQSVTFTATVSVQAPGAGTPTGTVTFLAGSDVLGSTPLDGSGVAPFTTDALDIGTTAITARYDGDSSFSTSEDVIAQDVVQGLTTTTFETTPATSRIGETVTLTATVAAVAPATGTPTGTVTFFDGLTTLGAVPLDGSGQAALTVSALDLGTHTLDARYGGSSEFASSETAGDHEVTRWPVSIDLTPSLTNAVTGQPVSFTVTVVDSDSSGVTPTGSISFSEFGLATPVVVALDATGTATVTLPAPLGQGANALIRAEYSGGTDHVPALTSTNVHVDPGEVDVQLVAVSADPYYGQSVEVTVTVSPVSPATGVPRGYFEILDRGASIRGPLERNGELVLSFSTPNELGAWAHELSASFDGRGWAATESPAVTVTVQPAPTDLVLTVDPSPSVLDHSATLTARITVPEGAAPPIGELATFDRGGDVLGTAPFAFTTEGHVEATLSTSFDAVGDHALRVRFSGPNHESSTSPIVVHSVDPHPTTVSVGSNGPTVPGDPVTVTVLVHALGTTDSPSGTVRLTLDGSPIAGPVPVTPDASSRSVALFDTLPPFPNGTSEIIAIFEPSANFADSSAAHDHVVAEFLSTVTLDVGTGTVAWGDDLEVTASVSTATSPTAPAATGSIIITDSTGTECVVAAGGTCTLSWSDTGTRSLTAEYSGDDRFGPAVSSTHEVDVIRRASHVLASVDPDPPVTGDSVAVHWEVPEHAGGEVTADIFGEHCTGAAVGTCESVVPTGATGVSYDVTVVFDGDDRYLPSHVVLPITPLQCHRLEIIGISVDEGSVSFDTPGNCNAGAGYLPGTAVKVLVDPVDNAAYDTVGVDWDGIGTTSGFVLDVFVGDGVGQVTQLRATLLRHWNCHTVDWVDSETVLNGLRTIGGALNITPAPNCPSGEAGWQRLDGVQRGSYLAGTTLVATADAFPGMSFYGFQLGGRTQVVDDDLSIQGLFGQTCVDLRVVIQGPGTAEATTATNCTNRLTSLRGFVPGSEVEVAARADAGAHLVRWERADDAGSEGEVFDSELRAQVVEWTNTVTVKADPTVQSVQALFASCSRLDIRFGSRFAGSEGHVERDRDGDCPTSDDPDLYRTGGEVNLEAVADVGVFGRWNHSDAESDNIRFLTLSTNEDVTLTPTFLSSRVGCVAVTARVADGAAALVSTTTPSSPFCLTGSLADGPATELAGEAHGPTDSLTFVGEASSGNPMLGWSFQADWESGGLRSVAGATATPELPRRGTLDAVLDTCVAIIPEITLVYPDGRTETSSAPQGFVQLADPDRDGPDCQFQAYGGAWRVDSSTVLAPLVVDAFEFVRWEGDLTASTDDLAEVDFDGSQPVLTVRAVYDVQCVNLTLRDPERTEFGPAPNCQPSSDAAETGSGGQYIVGTNVFLRGTMPGEFVPRSDHQMNDSHVWQGWVGDVEGDRFLNPLAVEMDQDRTIGFSYRETTFWEDTENVVYDAGDLLAESARKAGGIASMLAGEFFMGAGPVGALTGLVSVLGATNSLLEYLGANTGDFATFVNDAQQTVDWVGSGFTCATVWALDNGGAAEGVSDDDSAASTALANIGGAEVATGHAMELAALANEAQIQSTNAIRTTSVIDDLAASRKAYEQSLRLQKGSAALDGFGNVLTVASLGVTLYDIADAGGVNWADSTDAWTNPDVMIDCLESKMPAYLGIDTGTEVG